MIIPRYLTREVLQNTFAVTFVLLIIIMCGRFIKYLSEAAAGKIDASILLSIMAFRLPGFLELILPLGFFIALLLAYGRLYAEHEMTVLFACGMSRLQLLKYSFIPASVVAIVVSLLSLWLSPLGLQQAESLLSAEKAKNDFESLQPATFQPLQNDQLVSYSESIVDEGRQLNALFLANNPLNTDDMPWVVRAETGRYIFNEQYQQRYLQLNDGIRYEGLPGQGRYREIQFDHFAQHIEPPVMDDQGYKRIDAVSTRNLLKQDSLAATAALQWRLSLPLIIVLVTLVGVPLSHTSPRKGRFNKLFPAIVLYLLYIVGLNSARGSIEEGKLAPEFGLWYVHGIVIGAAIILISWPGIMRRRYKGD